MNIPLDEHGQPISGFVNRRRRTERDISELVGLAKGILSDGVVNNREVTFLQKWGETHMDAVLQWPINMIFTRLKQLLADGYIDEAERNELYDLLSQLVGGTTTLLLGFDGATTLPLDNPPPPIRYGRDDVFVFTGKMAYGPRAKCEREVLERGSRCESNVTTRTTFLVIGTLGSDDWAHTSYGRKIERAVELRNNGYPVRLVGEDYWANQLPSVSAVSSVG